MTVTSLGLTLAILGALGWTLFDVVRKKLAQKVLPTLLTVWLPLAQVPLLMAWATTTGPFLIPRASLVPMCGSIVLNVGALLAFMQAMRLSPMSLTIPLLSFTPVGTTLIGWLLQNQTPTLLQLGGIALVVAGAITLGLKSAQWPGLRAYGRDPGARRMAIAAVIWSFTAVIDQVALERGAGYWYAPAITAGVGLLMGAVLLLRGQGSALRGASVVLLKNPALLASAVLIGSTALVIQLESLRTAPVGFIETVKRGIGMSGAIVFGHLVFKEPIGLPKILAVVLLSLGVGLVVMGA
ncbi:MAG: DMT family transporter [Holophaga sp.]|nr:DMT family transporter [Holophaga sp.]